MRDPETMQIAVAAGETGHLVFSSLHTTDVSTTVGRIADSFPPERQNTIRQELAMALAAVMTQTLIPKNGGGMIPAAELLMVGYGARTHIRKNALQHLHQEITITRKQGSFTLEESLTELVKRDLDRPQGSAGARRPSRGVRAPARLTRWVTRLIDPISSASTRSSRPTFAKRRLSTWPAPTSVSGRRAWWSSWSCCSARPRSRPAGPSPTC